MTTMKKPNKSSSLKYIIEFAKNELGVELPADGDKDVLLAEVRRLLQEAGDAPGADDEENQGGDAGDQEEDGEFTETEQSETPTHYTIKVSKPSDTKLPDMVVCANGDNFQIHFGKPVKVPAVVYNILCDARRLIPAHRDMETNELVPESWEQEYNFSVIKEHFN
jgi:hypothetical protein